MSEKPVIMIQIAERDWTLDAVHTACRMARRSPAEIALVRMIPVQHSAWLGTDWGYLNFNETDQRELEAYQETVLDYGLECQIVCFQYTDFAEAVAEVAEQLDAQIVFATVPASLIPAWQRFRLWWLRRCLTRQQRHLIAQPEQVPAPAPLIGEAAREISHA